MRTVTIIMFLLSSMEITFSQKKECDFSITSRNGNFSQLIDSLQTIQLKTLSNKKLIPAFIKRDLDCWTGKFDIANPGKKYQSTDVVSWRLKPLPLRQLNYLGLSDHYLILAYKKGGRASSDHILIFKFDNDRIIDFWASGNASPSSYEEVLFILKSESDFAQSNDLNL